VQLVPHEPVGLLRFGRRRPLVRFKSNDDKRANEKGNGFLHGGGEEIKMPCTDSESFRIYESVCEKRSE